MGEISIRCRNYSWAKRTNWLHPNSLLEVGQLHVLAIPTPIFYRNKTWGQDWTWPLHMSGHILLLLFLFCTPFLNLLRKTGKEASVSSISLALPPVIKYSLPLPFQCTSLNPFLCSSPSQRCHGSSLPNLLFFFVIRRKHIFQKITACNGLCVFTLPLKSSERYIGKSSLTLRCNIDVQPSLMLLNTSWLRERQVIWTRYCSLWLIHLSPRGKEKGKSTVCLMAIITEIFMCLPPLSQHLVCLLKIQP